MSASVDILLSERKGILTVPLTAVNYDGDKQTPYVNVVKPDGQVEKKPIEVGAPTKDKIEVLSGINEGETIQVIDFAGNTLKGSDFGGADAGMIGGGMAPM